MGAYSENPEDSEGDQLEEDPRFVVLDVEEHRVLVAVRIDGTDDEGGDQGAEKGTPQSFHWKVVAHL